MFEFAIAKATPFNCSTQEGGAKVPCSCRTCIQSEENLKIHAGGDDKLQIQFDWPKVAHA